MVDFAVLMHDEVVRLDSDALNDLHTKLGPAGAENVVTKALEEMSVRLAELRKLNAERDFPALAKRARGLVPIGAQMGMTRFSQVALDVVICAQRYDETALDATLARLDRLADASLMAMWDLQNMRI